MADATSANSRHDPYAPWRFGAYRLFMSSFFLAVIGSQVFSTAIYWEVYQITKSELMVGYLGLINAAPVILLGLLAGHVADRFSRKKVLMITQGILALCPLAMAYVLWKHRASEWLLPAVYGLVLLNAIALAFGRPARGSLLPTLIPPHLFSAAVTWNSSLFETSFITGSAVGGLLLARSNAQVALVFSAGCTVLTVILTAFLPRHVPVPSKGGMTLKSLLAGWQFVYNSKLLLAIMTLDLLAVLLAGVNALLPAFAERYNWGSSGYGFLRAAPSIGAVLMALTIAHAPPMQRAGRLLIGAVVGYGFATLVFGLSTSYALSFAMLAFTGAFDNISVVIRHTLVQTLTPDSMRGRVTAVNQIFIASSNELGAFESGLTAKFFGPVASVVMGGIGTILVVIGVAMKWPQVRRLTTLNPLQESARDEEEIATRAPVKSTPNDQ